MVVFPLLGTNVMNVCFLSFTGAVYLMLSTIYFVVN